MNPKPEKTDGGNGFTWEDCPAHNPFPESDTPPPRDPYLVEKSYQQRVIQWEPFRGRDRALFARFEEIEIKNEGDKERFTEWADKNGRFVSAENYLYGSLWVYPKDAVVDDSFIESHLEAALQEIDGQIRLAEESESLKFWLREHQDLRFVTSIWEYANNNDAERLGDIIQWYIDQNRVTVREEYIVDGKPVEQETLLLNYKIERQLETLFDGKTVYPWAHNMFRYPEIIGPAKLYVQKMVNEKLIDYPMRISLAYDEMGNLKKRLQPTSLLSAMWYQLYLALTGEIKLSIPVEREGRGLLKRKPPV
jgi:hypothetical protein